MPPSPLLRRSPGVENRGDVHKRGRSLENGLSFKARDDDLTLFNEMQTRETDDFLLQTTTDDFDDILSSRATSFPEFKLGINIPARGESSDLLNTDGKNDYDWLLTPPDTPLFPSLDDEPEPVNVIHSGRERSRPISISRSSTMERSQRSSRGSPSPQRLSPSPRSGNSSFSGRPSSAPQRSSTPTRRPSPPLKPSTPPPRASTPPSRRTSAGPLGLRGTSPARGTSASPKVKPWQSNIPGFSLEAPPNLRTSLADRPASYVRGSSPASRTSPSRHSRQSMSPTASRSIGSSHSHERVSVASSGDDDADSLHSVPVNLSNRSTSGRGVGGLSNSRPVGFSKKGVKSVSPSSAPKRSFDSAIRQLERKNPQNMFRPLLSSVPTSTFYSGKSTVTHRTMISRNSSATTSSNASSNQAVTSGAHDTEGTDLYRGEMGSECIRTPFSDIHDEVFEDANPSEFRHGKPSDSKEIEASNVSICVRCGLEYHANDMIESEDNLCPECVQEERILTNSNATESQNSMMLLEEHTLQTKGHYPEQQTPELKVGPTPSYTTKPHSNVDITEGAGTMLGVDTFQSDVLEELTLQTKGHYPSENGQVHPEQQTSELKVGPTPSHTEGAGISVLLLKRSSSVKGPLIHGRTFSGSAISYDDLSYARDLASSMRSSSGRGTMSATSSIDLGSARQMLMHQHKRWSESSSKPLSTASSFSVSSVPVFQGSNASTSSHEESFTNIRHIVAEDNAESEEVKVMVKVTEDDESGMSKVLIGHDEVHVRDTVDEGTQKSTRTTELYSQNDVDEIAEDTSEIELGHSHPSSPRSQTDTVSREDLVGPTCPENDAKGAVETDTADEITEESTVTVEDQEGKTTRSLTLEEATDTILFCSSIIHDLAYTAATIAIDKEKENLEPLEGSGPTLTTNFNRTDPPVTTTKPQKLRKRRTDTDAKQPLKNTDERSSDENPTKSVVQNVGLTKNSDTIIPPKLESKCNCTIM